MGCATGCWLVGTSREKRRTTTKVQAKETALRALLDGWPLCTMPDMPYGAVPTVVLQYYFNQPIYQSVWCRTTVHQFPNTCCHLMVPLDREDMGQTPCAHTSHTSLVRLSLRRTVKTEDLSWCTRDTVVVTRLAPGDVINPLAQYRPLKTWSC